MKDYIWVVELDRLSHWPPGQRFYQSRAEATLDGVEDVKAELVADVQSVDLVRLLVKEMRDE